MKNVAVLTENVEFALFFFPTPGDLTAEESLPPGICHSRQKNGNARAGGQPKGGGLGAGGIDCINGVWFDSRRRNHFPFFFFGRFAFVFLV